MFEEVLCEHLVEECGVVLEFVDVDFFGCGTDELLAAIFGSLSNARVFSVSLVDDLGLLHFHHRCIFGNLVIPQANAL